MAYTTFGEYLRILRIKNHEVMGDMAAKLEVSVPFLSAVENGRKNIPRGWIEKIAQMYSLSAYEVQSLKTAEEESLTQYKIRVGNAGVTQRKAAMQFARSFDNMDDETAARILELLNRQGGND